MVPSGSQRHAGRSASLVPHHTYHLRRLAVRRCTRLSHSPPSRARRGRLQTSSAGGKVCGKATAKSLGAEAPRRRISAATPRASRPSLATSVHAAWRLGARGCCERSTCALISKDAERQSSTLRRSHKASSHVGATDIGWSGRVWGVRSKAIAIRDRAHQVNAFHYIIDHEQEGAWVFVSRDDPTSPGKAGSDSDP